MDTLSSRERVLKTFARQIPDRVPINYCANAGIDRRLKQHYGLSEDDTAGLWRVLGVDFRGVGAPYIGPLLHPPVPDRHVDLLWGIHTRWIEHEAGGYWDYCDFPLRDAGAEQVEAWPMPSPDHFDYASIRAQCAQHESKAIYTGDPGMGDIINSNSMLRSMEQVLVDLLTDEPAGLRLVDRRLAVQYGILERVLEAGRGRIDFLWLGEDLGTQIGPLIAWSCSAGTSARATRSSWTWPRRGKFR